MEGRPGARKGQQLLAAYFVHRAPALLRGQGGRSHGLGGHHREAGRPGLSSPGERESCMELSSVELREGGAGGHATKPAAGQRFASSAHDAENQHRGSGDAAALAQLAQAGGAAQDGIHFLPGHWTTGSSVVDRVPGVAATQLQCQHPADQDAPEAGEDGTPAIGESAPGEVPSAAGSKRGGSRPVFGKGAAAMEEGPEQGQGQGSSSGETGGHSGAGVSEDGGARALLQRLAALATRPLLRLSLGNPHQLCYANSAVHAFLWMGYIFMHRAGFDSTMTFGQLASQCLLLLRLEATSLLQLLPWRSLLQRWKPILDRQQDAAEFLAHVLNLAKPPAYDGQWQSRYMIGRLSFVADRGHCFQPLALEIHSDGLQASIQQWHQQHYISAFMQAPAMLYLQLKRYSQRGPTTHKDTRFLELQVGTAVWLPVFSSAAGLDIRWETYAILSVVVHTGSTVHSGHYQALLSGFRSSPVMQHWVTVITDDGRSARDCSAAQWQHAQCNCYLIGLCRLTESNDAAGNLCTRHELPESQAV